MNVIRCALAGLFASALLAMPAGAEDLPQEPPGGFQRLFQRTKSTFSRTPAASEKSRGRAQNDATRATWNQPQPKNAAAAKRTPPDNRPKRPRTVSEYMAKERP